MKLVCSYHSNLGNKLREREREKKHAIQERRKTTRNGIWVDNPATWKEVSGFILSNFFFFFVFVSLIWVLCHL